MVTRHSLLPQAVSRQPRGAEADVAQHRSQAVGAPRPGRESVLPRVAGEEPSGSRDARLVTRAPLT